MRKSILVCDDEEGVRESLNLILEKDYTLFFASSGPEALALAASKPVDIVLLDIKMPRLGGLDVLKALKEINPELKVIIATGYKSVEAAQEAVRLGATDYIVKPFDTKRVLQVVRRNL